VTGTDVGHIKSQHPDDFFVIDLDDPQTLVEAVALAADARASSPRASLVERRRSERVAEREAVRDAHALLYATARAEISTEARA
jgi:hypothetical protein